MPSKKPTRKRVARAKKSTQFGWSGILWFLVVVNLAAGFCLSPATGLKSVSVKGASPEQSLLIEKRLQPWSTILWVWQSRAAMETAILADNRLESAKATSNLFGRGQVVVERRKPVARVNDRDAQSGQSSTGFAIYLDRRGTLYRDEATISFKGPGLTLPAGAKAPQLTVVPSWPLTSVANVAVKSQAFLGELPFKVVLDERSVLSLQVVDGPQIVLGTESDLDEKFDVLERAFREEKDKVLRYKSINVSAPDRPVYGS